MRENKKTLTSLGMIALAGLFGFSAYFFTPTEKVAISISQIALGEEHFTMPVQEIAKEVNASYQYCGPGYYGPVTSYGTNYSNYSRGIASRAHVTKASYQALEAEKLRARLLVPARS